VKPISEAELDEMFAFAERDDLGPKDLARLEALRDRAAETLAALGVRVDAGRNAFVDDE
jgi:hypothetical protein